MKPETRNSPRIEYQGGEKNPDTNGARLVVLGKELDFIPAAGKKHPPP